MIQVFAVVFFLVIMFAFLELYFWSCAVFGKKLMVAIGVGYVGILSRKRLLLEDSRII